MNRKDIIDVLKFEGNIHNKNKNILKPNKNIPNPNKYAKQSKKQSHPFKHQ